MSLRSWAIRGTILAGVAVLAALGWVASSWVSPERVRAQLVAHLSDQLADVDVHVGSARMRLLGGIAVSDVKLTRRGDDAPFLVVPAAVLYHDKEQLNRGRLVIKKIELESPEVRLDRGPDGTWNVAGLLRDTPPDRPLPTFVVKGGGTLHVTDRGPDPLPPLTLTDAHVTVLNDPLPVLAVQARATAKGFGPVTARARVNRLSGALSVGVDLPEFPLGEVAAAAADKFVPDLAPHLGGLAATASVVANLTFTPDAPQKWRHDVRVELKNARFTHPELPWPVETIAGTVTAADGRVKVDNATAVVNGAKVKLSLETRPFSPGFTPDTPPPGPGVNPGLNRLEDHLQRLDLSVTGVALTDALFERLPKEARDLRQKFSPAGQLDAGYKFVREPGGWRRVIEVRPRQMTAMYEKFKYPVSDLGGVIERTTTQAAEPVVAVNLVGTAGGQRITITGRVTGDGPDPGLSLRVAGNNVPLDDKVVSAFPPKYAELVRRFRAAGRGDFVATITQQPGVNLCENEFRVDVREATVNYTGFPYPLEKAKGGVVVRVTSTDETRPVRPGEPLGPPPDRDEIVLDRFTAVHAGAAVTLHGSKRPIPNSRDRKLTLHVAGNNCPVDADMRAALAAINIGSVWDTFNPRGALTFTADVEVIDRAPRARRQGAAGELPGARVSGPLAAGTAALPADQPPTPEEDPPLNPVTDLRLTFNFSGPTVTPSFFPYELTEFGAWLQYMNGRVDVQRVVGRHGEVRVGLDRGEVRFYPDGVVWANLGGLEVKPLVADAALLKALPGRFGPGLESLKLRGGAELVVKHLVVLTPPDAPAGPPGPLAPPPAGVGGVGRPHAVARGQSPGYLPTPPQPDPIVYWDAEMRLAGASFDTGVAWEQVFGAVGVRGRYEGTHVGLVRGNVWLNRAVIAKQPLTQLFAKVWADPQQPDPTRPGEFFPVEVRVTDITGDLFHGVLGGEARVALADPTRFDLWLTATDVQLDEVARHYKLGSDADLKGIAQAQLRVFNRPDPRTGALVTEGTGKIDVPTGRMYNLPVLLDLVKVLKLQAPDKTAFEEAHATFRILGDRVKVEQIDLIGKALCLGGSGELDMSGDYVKFDFYTVASQVLARMIRSPVGDLTAFLSKNLFTIKMTRENGELKYKTEAVPVITEPARAAADRMRARAAKMFGGGW